MRKGGLLSAFVLAALPIVIVSVASGAGDADIELIERVTIQSVSEEPPSPGTYTGVVQDYVGTDLSTLAEHLDRVSCRITRAGELLFSSPDGTPVVFGWNDARWILSGPSSHIEATPFVVGELLLVEYVAYEGETRVGGARFYLVSKDPE